MRLLLLLWVWLQKRYHLAIVTDDLRYLKQLESGGILDSISIRAFRSQIAIREARVIALEADLRTLRQEVAHG